MTSVFNVHSTMVEVVVMPFVDGQRKVAVKVTRPVLFPTYKSYLFGLILFEDGNWRDTGEVDVSYACQGPDGKLYRTTSPTFMSEDQAVTLAAMVQNENWKPLLGGGHSYV